MKKILALVLALLICMPITGCDEQMKIKMACDKELMDSVYITRAIEYYESHSSTVVELVEYSRASIFDSSVDIIIHPFDADMTSAGISDIFYDFSGETWVNDIQDYCFDSIMYDGHVYGFPFGTANITGCYYNKTMFLELGIAVPQNQNEFEQMCDAIKATGIVPIYVAGSEPSSIVFELGLENVLSKRPAYVSELNNGEIKMSEIPGSALVADWWKKSGERGWFEEDWHNATGQMAAEQLGAGYAAMVICDDAWINENLGADKTYKSVDFGVMPMYMGDSEGVILGSQIPVIAVKKDNTMAGVALDFVSMLSDPDVYNVCYSGVYTVPVLSEQSGIITPEQFGSVNEDDIVSMSAFYPRIMNFDSRRGANAVIAYTKGEITLDACLKELGNGR